MPTKYRCLALCIISTGILLSEVSDAAFFQPLPDAPFGTGDLFLTDVSADGSVAVGYVQLSLSEQEAIRYDNGVITRLGDLAGGLIQSQAFAVSDDGSVIVGRGLGASGSEAFRWENGVMTGLGDLPGGVFESAANAVSADGSVITGGSRSTAGLQGFRWENGTMTGIPGLAGGVNFSSIGLGISDDGSVIVGDSWNGSGFEAYRWENGVTTGLGIEFAPGLSSTASDTSDDGSVVVGATATSTGQQAMRWENGVMTSLGSLTPFVVNGGATAVSGDGSIVVGTSLDPFVFFGRSATIWNETDGLLRLGDFLANDLALNLDGWVLQTVEGISDDGTTLVGLGIDTVNLRQGSWIANISEEPEVVPEPGTVGLFVLGVLGIALYRRRR